MKTKVIAALLVLGIVQSVLSQPQQPYHFSTSETTRSGEARLDIDGETITNITTVIFPTAENITVEITDGGVGSNHVAFSYKLPLEAEGHIETNISTSDIEFIVNVTNYHTPGDNFIEYFVEYNTSNTPRTVLFSSTFDREPFMCGGQSLWFYGNGSREVKGGYPNNHVDILLGIPESVIGVGYYRCLNLVDDVSSRKVTQLPHLIEPKGQLALHQLYDTLEPTTTPVKHGGLYWITGILSYEGGVEWFNGTGVWNITGGGPGFDYIYFNFTHDPYTWGIVQYDFMTNW